MKKIFFSILVCFAFVTFAHCQQDNLEMKIFKINHASIETIAELANNLKSNEGRVTFDANTNSLIVLDNPAALMRIEKVIQELDARPKQVEVSVIVADATASFWRKIGIEAGSVVIPDVNFEAVLNLIEQDKNVNKRSKMTVRTLSGEPAQLQVSKEEIIGEEKIIYSSGQEVTNVVREPLGDFLEVLPQVNNDNTITMTLRPSSSNLSESGAPEEKTVFTRVVLNNKDTVAIGGVEQTKRESKTSSFPGFNIPIFKEDNQEGRQVMMFLTVRILD
jgi:type II secretory pathway component GspD/PulD (secretin)